MLPLLMISFYIPIPPPPTLQDPTAAADDGGGALLEYRGQESMEVYAGALWKLLQQQTVSDGGNSVDTPPSIRLQWKLEGDDDDDDEEQQILESTSWRTELDFALWNLAAQSLRSTSSTITPTTKLEWNATSKNLQTAASFLHHCSPENNNLSADAALYETLFVAEGQRCVYQAFACQPRPKHFLLAKLCMTVANLYGVLEEEYELPTDIADAVRAWGMYVTALAEYHQSIVDAATPAMAAARLENARKFASFCADFLESCAIQIPPLADFTALLDGIPSDPDVEVWFDVDELPEIPIQPAVIKINTKLESMLLLKTPPSCNATTSTNTTDHHLSSRPTTTNMMMRPEFQPLLAQFRSTLQELVQEKARLAERKTETARTALQSVHLPQSITAYTNAEQTLHNKTHPQNNNNNNDTAELQRSAETAWELVAHIDRRIDDDLTGDIQTTFRKALTQYQTLLETAAASDSALRDRPLPKVPNTTPIIVTELSQSLAQLSTLFHERDDAVQRLRSDVDQLSLQTALCQCESEDDMRHVLETVRQKLEQDHVAPMEQNFERQSKLLYQIMQENDRFQRDEDLALLEDAVCQHDRFARHLQEGLAFYQSILPKLHKLDAQVNEVCDRLSAERTVDDEKVANLVAMDFEFEKVVSALRKHDNNLEQALNDLLSC